MATALWVCGGGCAECERGVVAVSGQYLNGCWRTLDIRAQAVLLAGLALSLWLVILCAFGWVVAKEIVTAFTGGTVALIVALIIYPWQKNIDRRFQQDSEWRKAAADFLGAASAVFAHANGLHRTKLLEADGQKIYLSENDARANFRDAVFHFYIADQVIKLYSRSLEMEDVRNEIEDIRKEIDEIGNATGNEEEYKRRNSSFDRKLMALSDILQKEFEKTLMLGSSRKEPGA